jgi:AcrR family transcriptional regulator
MNYSKRDRQQAREPAAAPVRARGRRPGRPDTRALLLEVAGRRFRADGYQSVTLRSIADEAEVDVALISYYFGSKRGLFTAALTLPANPIELLLQAMRADPATVPERILRTLIGTWDDPDRGGRMRALMSTGLGDPQFTRLLAEGIGREIIDVLTEHIGGAQARSRATAVAVQLTGLIFSRYILPLEPMASMTVDELVHVLAPGLRPLFHVPPRRPRANPS